MPVNEPARPTNFRTPQRRGGRALRSALIFVVLAVFVIAANVEGALAARRHLRRTVRNSRVFYVSLYGRDSNSGTSPARPWRTIARADEAILQPGDKVLFKGGESFSDGTLSPEGGFLSGGTRRAPIVFASYGGGVATISQGVWFGANAAHPHGARYLTFTGLQIGPTRGFQGTGDHIVLFALRFSEITSPTSSGVAIQTEGSDWVIAANRIDRTAGSGMLLGFSAQNPGDPAGGSHYRVYRNVIVHTGLDPGLGYPTHAIYVKVTNATITHNYISDFRDDGVSARYHGAIVEHNRIAHGAIGIGWYQYDTTSGTSRFAGNTIIDAASAGIFVCGVQEGCVRPIENFVIEHNRLVNTRKRLNLQPSSGDYVIRNNP
jgi:hypothetical protein